MIENNVSSFHLVSVSPWPLSSGFAVLFLTLGGLHAFHYGSFGLLCLGSVMLLGVMFFWFQDIVKENQAGSHKTQCVKILRLGMILFMLSEVFFFFGFFWAYFHNTVHPSVSDVIFEWPPFRGFDAWGVPLLKTVLLVCSGVSLTWSHHVLMLKHQKLVSFILGFVLTLVLGVFFLGFQLLEYVENPFSFNSTIYGSVFYVLTGFHGFHVFVGVCMLTVCFFRFFFSHFNKNNHTKLLIASWYWHFVDVVWLFLFIFVYVKSSF